MGMDSPYTGLHREGQDMSTNDQGVGVSIITASYNYANYIDEAINSIRAQTHTNWELLVVDDGSEDNSIEVIMEYVKRDSRVRLIQHPDRKNHGLAATVELGVQEARYPVVAFLESDDVWKPQSLEKRLEVMQTTGSGAVFSMCEPFGDAAERFPAIHGYLGMIDDRMKFIESPLHFLSILLTENNFLPTFSVVMVRTELLRKCSFATPDAPWLDYWLWPQVAQMAPISYCPEALTLWRIHGKSYNTSNQGASEGSRLRNFRKKLRLQVARNALRQGEWGKALYVFGVYTNTASLKRKFKKMLRLCKAAADRQRRPLLQETLTRFLDDPFFAINLWQKPVVQTVVETVRYEEDPYGEFALRALQAGTSEASMMRADKRILIIIHELSLTGAPVVALETARFLQTLGVVPVFLSQRGGPVVDQLKELGIPCILDPRLKDGLRDPQPCISFCNLFDAIIMISLANAPVFRVLNHVSVPKFWWVHETAEGFFYANIYPDFRLKSCFEATDEVWLGSPLSREPALKHCPAEKMVSMLYGLKEQKVERVPMEKTPLTFLMAGSIIPRKGQQIFLEAIAKLPEELRKQARFIILGDPYDPDPFSEYTALVHELAIQLPEVSVIPGQSHDEYLKQLAQCHVLVSPSTDDPMPVVVTDALMLSKPCICSDAIGQAAILQNELEILIFPSEDTDALAARIRQIMEHPERLEHMADPARKAFETHFSLQAFEEKLQSQLHKVLQR